ncbi:uncharacterized protein LOC119398552 [Rhipicephalus sanguineus]|uniref:uncharacterized protein LOC119398552 n=1 Tax=Rhipicephalus sanguineus TaxID=34632 RepID=UPI00189632CA|nr:uncharacterized protein LOC119398552 [Rhipicephalus sanguineus]
MPRKATGKHMKKTGKDERFLQHQEEISERQNVPAIEDRPLEKAKEALPRSQATSKPPPTTAATPKPASNTSAPAAPAATAPAAPRNAAKPHLRSSSGTRVSLAAFERDSDPWARETVALLKKQEDEEYQNFEAWLARKRATQRAAIHAAHASTSSAQTPTESPNHLEQQAVTTIGDWLLNKAKDAAPVAADLPEPAAVTTPADADAPASAHAETSVDEAMDTTATSRKRGREEDAAEGPRKQANPHATAAITTTAAAAPAPSPPMRDDASSSTATPAVLLAQAASAD